MVKRKKKIKKAPNPHKYQIKTRNRDKKLYSMSREIKNLQENQWFLNTVTDKTKINPTSSRNSGNSLSTRFSKIFKKGKNKLQLKARTNTNKKNNIKKANQFGTKSNKSKNNNHNDFTHNLHYSKNSKKNKVKNNQKNENVKKSPNEVFKYIYHNKEYFELKEVLSFLYDDLYIELDSPNNKIKDKDEFKNKMNDMLKKYFVIYYNKILISQTNLFSFLNYISKYVKFDANEVIKLLIDKSKIQVIQENISLEQYFRPTLFLVEK